MTDRSPRTMEIGARRESLAWERAALILLTAGAVVSFGWWLLGACLILMSRRHDRREKLFAGLLLPGGLKCGAWLTAATAGWTSFSCSRGSSGATLVLGGPLIPGTIIESPLTCTTPALPGWLGLVVAACLLGLSLAGPFYAWHRLQHRYGPTEHVPG